MIALVITLFVLHVPKTATVRPEYEVLPYATHHSSASNYRVFKFI